MQIVAVGWQMYAITGDPLDLGSIGLSQFMPFVLLILPAGQAADHYDRSRIVTLCYVTEATSARSLLLVFTLQRRTGDVADFRGDGAARRRARVLDAERRNRCCRTWCRRRASRARSR